MRKVQMSLTTLLVLKTFLENERDLWGLEILNLVDIKSGSLYPILLRLERAKFLTSIEELIDPRVEGRSRRRYYRLTRVGRQESLKVFRKLRLHNCPKQAGGFQVV